MTDYKTQSEKRLEEEVKRVQDAMKLGHKVRLLCSSAEQFKATKTAWLAAGKPEPAYDPQYLPPPKPACRQGL